MGRLQDKVAIVTGSARGTGAAIARLFVEEGARVLVSDVRDEPGEKLARELGGSAAYRRLDVRREADWQAAVDEVRGRFGGRIDVLVNNAAILKIAAIADTSPEELTALFEVNQLGPFLGIRAVAPVMREQGGGSIVNLASSDGVKGMNGVVGYASTKWGLRGITRASAMELARHRIRVNAVCPEAGNPEMSAPYLPEGVDPAVAAEHNADSLLRSPEAYTFEDRIRDVARAVLFLACDDCPTATATDLVIDGGLTAGYRQPGIPGYE
ncbi:MAG: SDR family NAD(P)-dependent oxidoreductase [Myxococcota bacterium]|nr:SDR family NAD(P)-dependent oxidoreductase [Myxococcota bacterium]